MKRNILFILSVLIFSVSFVSCSSDDDNDPQNPDTEQPEKPLTTLNVGSMTVDGENRSITGGSLGNNGSANGVRNLSLIWDNTRTPIVLFAFSNFHNQGKLMKEKEKYLYKNSKYNFINNLVEDNLTQITAITYFERNEDGSFTEYSLFDDAKNEVRLTFCASREFAFQFKVKVKAENIVKTIEGNFTTYF